MIRFVDVPPNEPKATPPRRASEETAVRVETAPLDAPAVPKRGRPRKAAKTS